MFALGKSTSFPNNNLLTKLEHIKSSGNVRTGCVELDNVFSFSWKKFDETDIRDKLMSVDFAATMLLNRKKLMGVITKTSFL